MTLRSFVLLACLDAHTISAGPHDRLIRIEISIHRCRPGLAAELVSSQRLIASDGERSAVSIGTNNQLDFTLAVLPSIQPDGRISLDLQHDVMRGADTDHFTAHRMLAAGTALVIDGADLSRLTVTAKPL